MMEWSYGVFIVCNPFSFIYSFECFRSKSYLKRYIYIVVCDGSVNCIYTTIKERFDKESN